MKLILCGVLAFCVCGAAIAQEPPGPAAGKWSVTMDGTRMDDQCWKKQQSFGDVLRAAVQTDPDVKCSKITFSKAGGVTVGSIACTVEGTPLTSEMTITGDMSSAYKATTVTKTMGHTVTMVIDAKRIGAC